MSMFTFMTVLMLHDLLSNVTVIRALFFEAIPSLVFVVQWAVDYMASCYGS